MFTFKDISKSNDNFFEIEIKSVIPDLWITTRYYDDDNNIKNEQVAQLKNGKTSFKFSKKADYKSDVHFHFSTIWENTSDEKIHTIKKETIKKA
ncbi:hypothetical protein H9X57_14815 [Flavobacterium piscinae]|uniref:hypothetical protein n=1 Tax=Flavobacterium piscinae TaxID=2506424 RepID=UPI00199369CA|nr:hypothetical protein [Flavobacterium piscinae]MBC8884167.1 hypothetical protein [Flavobacterium piscinae]